MNTLIVKEGIAVYLNAELGEKGTKGIGFFDPTTRLDNASIIQIETLPESFEIGKYAWDGTKLTRVIFNAVTEDPDLSFFVSKKLKDIDAETSAAILAGFDYDIDGVSYHFSYDSFDQQNFSDAANVANLIKAGVQGLPQEREWNAYKNWTPESGGILTVLVFDVDAFISLYTGGALYHKATCMTEGAERKKAVADAVARNATVAEIQAI